MHYEKSLQHALLYHRMGLNVIPAAGKRPLIRWRELEKKRLSLEETESLFERYRGANIALITGRISGVVVIDIDDREKHASLVEKLEKIETWKAKTRRGIHYFFATDREYPSRKKAGLDFQAEGGIIILPYSRHPDDPSVVYRWLHDFRVRPAGLLKGRKPIPREAIIPRLYPFEELDDSIRKVVLEEESSHPEGSSYNPSFIGTPEGLRNNTLTIFLGTLLARKPSMTEEELLHHALMINRTFIPPLPEDEVRRTVASIYRRHVRQRSIIRKVCRVINRHVNGRGLNRKTAVWLASYVKHVSSSYKEFFHILLKTGLYWHIPEKYRKNLSEFYSILTPPRNEKPGEGSHEHTSPEGTV